MVADKIFVVVFTAFIAVVTAASVVVAKGERLRVGDDSGVRVEHVETLPSKSSLLELAVEKPKFVVIPAEDLLKEDAPIQPSILPVKDAVTHTVDVVVGQPVPMTGFVVLSADDLEKAITKGMKAALKKDPQPRWKGILGWAWFGIKLPYQALMLVPAEVRILVMLWLTLKFKPEVFGWALKKIIKNSPGMGKFLFTEFGMPMAEEAAHIFVDGAKANIAEFVPVGVMSGAANAADAAAATTAQLANAWMPECIQNLAISWGY